MLSFYNSYIPITCFMLVSPSDYEFQAIRLAHGCAWQSSHSIYVVSLISNFSYSSLNYKYRSETSHRAGVKTVVFLVGLCCHKEINMERLNGHISVTSSRTLPTRR